MKQALRIVLAIHRPRSRPRRAVNLVLRLGIGTIAGPFRRIGPGFFLIPALAISMACAFAGSPSSRSCSQGNGSADVEEVDATMRSPWRVRPRCALPRVQLGG